MIIRNQSTLSEDEEEVENQIHETKIPFDSIQE